MPQYNKKLYNNKGNNGKVVTVYIQGKVCTVHKQGKVVTVNKHGKSGRK
jgi:hypothetical protein